MSTIEQSLDRKSLIFLVQVAEQFGYPTTKISHMLDDNINEFRNYEIDLRIRICDAVRCTQVFNEGFLTEDSNVFCSEECCYNSIDNLTDYDFGESILYTSWYEETLISR